MLNASARGFSWVVLCAVLTGCSGQQLPPVAKKQPEDVTLSICELDRRGATMNGRAVRIKATLALVQPEWSRLVDPRCPDVRFALLLPESADRSIEHFLSAIGGRDGYWAMEVSGTFEARTGPMAVVAPPDGTIRVKKIWSFEQLPSPNR
jgi:hypothetical protein